MKWNKRDIEFHHENLTFKFDWCFMKKIIKPSLLNAKTDSLTDEPGYILKGLNYIMLIRQAQWNTMVIFKIKTGCGMFNNKCRIYPPYVAFRL